MLFPLANAQRNLEASFADLELEGTSLCWSDRGGVSTLAVRPVTHSSCDGLVVSEIVTLSYRSPSLSALAQEQAGYLNRLASLAALTIGNEDGKGCLASKVGIFTTDQMAAEQLYSPILCAQAAIMGWYAECLAFGLYEIAADQCPFPGADQRPPVAVADFEAAKTAGDRIGVAGAVGDGFCTFEFPWDPGDDRRMLRGRTSLLWIRSTYRHPLFGNGLLATLELPLSPQRTALPVLVDDLNAWELGGLGLPPLFGSWCIGPRAPSFTTFIPNQLCLRGMVLNLFHWAQVRHGRVCRWVAMSSAPT